jgi:hypothetical protein
VPRAKAKERIIWKRELKPRKFELLNRLMPEQEENVRIALAVLRVRHGSLWAVARIMRVNPDAVVRASKKNGRPAAGLALRVAQVAGVPVDDVLQGRFPCPGSCPMCGHQLEPGRAELARVG